MEAWDPRSRSRAGILDCAPHVLAESSFVKGVPAVTSLRYGITVIILNSSALVHCTDGNFFFSPFLFYV